VQNQTFQDIRQKFAKIRGTRSHLNPITHSEEFGHDVVAEVAVSEGRIRPEEHQVGDIMALRSPEPWAAGRPPEQEGIESQSSNASSAATRRSGTAGLGQVAIVAGVETGRRMGWG